MADSSPPEKWSDEAKRASDIVNGYIAFMDWDELVHKWIAIRLSDGGHDGTLYDTKRDAVRHQLDEFLCAYVSMRNLIGGTSARDMEIFLKWNRDAYDAGFRLPDPREINGGPELIMTTPRYDNLKNRYPVMSKEEERIALDVLGLTSDDLDLMARILAR